MKILVSYLHYPVLHSFKSPAVEESLQSRFALEPLINKCPVRQRTEGVIFHFFSCHPSCYGTVSSLNGEPEQGVAVEAVGQKDCSIYGEDTVTDEEGKFRLRGLLVRLCASLGISLLLSAVFLWDSLGQWAGGGTLESPCPYFC